MTPSQKLIDAAAEAICDAEFWPGHWAALEKDSNECAVYRKQAVSAVTVALRAAVEVAENGVRQECCGNTGDGPWPECCGNPDVIPMYPNEIAAAISSLIPQERQNDR